FPQDLSAAGVEGAEVAIVGATREHDTAAGREHRSPQRRIGEGLGPDLLTCVEVPGLQLTDVVGAGNDTEHQARSIHSGKTLTRRIGDRLPRKRLTQILVGRDIEQARLRAVGHRRPILAAPQRRAELGLLAGPRLAVEVDVRAAGLGVEALEYILLYERLAVDEVDLVGGPLKHPQIAVTGDVDETLDRPTAAL